MRRLCSRVHKLRKQTASFDVVVDITIRFPFAHLLVKARNIQATMSTTMQIRRPHGSNCIHPGRNQTAISYIKIGAEHLSCNDFTCASSSFDTALSILELPLRCSLAMESLEKECNILYLHTSSDRPIEPTTYPPDIYEEDECDVGPRMMREPILPDFVSEENGPILEAIIFFNKGLLYHKMGNFLIARKMFETSAFAVQTMLGFTPASTTFLRLAMCAHNNLGVLSYIECKEGVAAASFEAAAQFGKHLVSTLDMYKLDYATAISNWCRVNWMRGDIGLNLYFPLEEILRIRSESLTWDHIDVAAAHYNVAVAEYSRQNNQKAIIHIKQYLAITTQRAEFGLNDLNSVPASIYQLLIENEEKIDCPSQELVRGLRALQEKRQEFGPNSLEVACILNYVGTLLFHLQDFERAIIFFHEELRLEDAPERVRNDSRTVNPDAQYETTSITVTCNNIGRILQELGKYKEALSYYYRALQPVYGDVATHLRNPSKEFSELISLPVRFPSSCNLYSTVWYNLGLIHDKLECYNEAINAFKVALQLRKALLGNNHSDVACLLYNIGVLQMEQQRLDDATVSFREALSIRRVTSPGRLNDRHVVKTLVKLAALHRDAGNVHGAMDVAKEIFAIQIVTSEYDEISRMKEVGATLRFSGELHHSIGDLHTAITLSIDSVSKLRIAADLSAKQQSQSLDPFDESLLIKDRIANIEQFVLTLLLLGSLYYEIGDPLNATTVLNEAAIIVQGTVTSSTLCPAIPIPSTLFALQEVTTMLGTFQCAPMA